MRYGGYGWNLRPTPRAMRERARHIEVEALGRLRRPLRTVLAERA